MELFIICNREDLRTYIEANADLDFEFFAPSVRTAERQYLAKLLGVEQFVELAEYIEDPSDAENPLAALVPLAQEAVANLAMAFAVSRLSVSFDENGAKRDEKSAFQYQEINLRDSYTRAGFNALDDLLLQLESKPDAYPKWKASSAYKDYKKYFIVSGLQFSEHFDIRNARYTYLSIRYILQRVEKFDIKPALGNNLFKKLKEQILSGEIDAAYEQLLDEYIRPALALLTIANAVFEKAVDVSDFGVSTNIIQDNSNSQQKQAAPMDKIKEVSQRLMEAGNKYLSLLADELAGNATAYPDYQTPPSDSPIFKITNKQDNSYVAF